MSISGYDYATTATVSPIDEAAFDLLKQTVLFTDDDAAMLHQAGEILADQVDEILDLWYGFVGSHPHLVHYFSNAAGTPDANYLARVRARFGQWILDLCQRPYDQQWLNYQHEIALRHTRQKKNEVDHADAVEHIGLRYMIAFIYPITATIRPFLAAKGHDAETVEKMFQAWFKAVVLTVTLWSAPYVSAESDF